MEFNLIKEPWIPCFDGKDVKELNLLESLSNAHDLKAISDPSPLVTISLYRLLVAVLHRVFGPASEEEWSNLWKAGRFDRTKLEGYLSKWSHRFDLFDDERPFFQDRSVEEYQEKGKSSTALLKQELSCGINPLLFDHTTDKTKLDTEPAEAARLLIAYNGYALDPKGAGGLTMKSGLLAGGILFMNQGESLFQTLLLSMVRYDPQHEIPSMTKVSDKPCWEREIKPAEERIPEGYLDWLTWQSRKMLLFPEDTNGRVVVNEVVRARGDSVPDQFSDGSPSYYFDVMLAFRLNEKPTGTSKPWEPLKFRTDKALWRDFFALFESAGGNERHKYPKVVGWVGELIQDGFLEDVVIPVSAFGMSKNQAKVEFWKQEGFSLPARYLSDPDLREKLHGVLTKVDGIGWRLASAGKKLVSDVTNRASSGPTDLTYPYWSAMEPKFREFVLDLAIDKEETTQFLLETKRVALDNYNRISNSLGTSAKVMKTAAFGGRNLARKINELLKDSEEEDE